MRIPRLIILAASCVPVLAAAQVSPQCDEPRALGKHQLLRRLSIDLRGHVPSYEEYLALDGQHTVPQSTVQSWLAGDGFKAVMRRYHEDLLWPNVTNVQLNGTSAQLVLLGTPAAYSISSTQKRRAFRATTDANTALGEQCGDFEQTQFNAGFVPMTAGLRTTVVNGTTVRQEGWRMVTPYWSTTPIKVCAFDAMETERVTVNGKVIECNTVDADGRPECGCGPHLRFCYGPANAVRIPIQNAMREQLARMVDKVSVGGAPYTDLVTAQAAPVNGPLVFWKKYLAPHLTYARIVALPDPQESLANADFSDPTWRDVDRGSPLHAGVLTTPIYLLRFQTNRGRANRYRIDFECESFVPPTTIETAADGCKESGGDLTGRCTCRYCHRQLEPLAAHWGQFAESGTTLLTDLTRFPRMNGTCVGSTSAYCGRFYVTSDEADEPGSLLPYQYANAAHPEVAPALAGGPRAKVDELIASGTFARCAVKRTWSYFMKRDLRVLGSDPAEAEALRTLTQGFTQHGYQLPWLVEQIVSQPSYRSVR